MHTVNIAGSNIWPVFIDLLFVLLSKEAKQVWGGGGGIPTKEVLNWFYLLESYGIK